MKTKNVSRNAPCPCGSGLKYKNCHAGKVPWYKQRLLTGIIGILIILGGALLVWAGSDRPENGAPGAAPAGQVWSPEHGHYHDAP